MGIEHMWNGLLTFKTNFKVTGWPAAMRSLWLVAVIPGLVVDRGRRGWHLL